MPPIPSLPSEHSLGRKQALALFPDIPVWVEVIALLEEETSHFWSEPGAFGVCDAPDGLGAIVGSPSASLLQNVAQMAEEILAFGKDIEVIKQMLPTWHVEQALIYARNDKLPLPPRKYPTRLLAPDETEALQQIPEELMEEITEAVSRNAHIIAAFDGDLAVSFAYTACITQGSWDMSIDTLAPYRRRGFAQDAASALIEHMEETRRTAAWGAVLSNIASQSLAKKLGYTEVDTLWLLTSPNA